ncbi:unnamed protein product [Closterium sp. Naga37s-1]|nr:unnamed protein product [Closterium sp. Naga37s-1]
MQARLKREREEDDQCAVIKVARDEDLQQQIGRNVYLNLADHGLVRSFRVQKQMRFTDFKKEVEKEMTIPVDRQRFWVWGKRRSDMDRPSQQLSAEEEVMTVGTLKGNTPDLRLFLEDTPPPTPDLPERAKDDILLFVKLYDPSHDTISPLGHFLHLSLSLPPSHLPPPPCSHLPIFPSPPLSTFPHLYP